MPQLIQNGRVIWDSDTNSKKYDIQMIKKGADFLSASFLSFRKSQEYDIISAESL